MTSDSFSPVQEIARRKALFLEVRERARQQFLSGTPGIQIAASLCEGTEQVLLQLVDETLNEFGDQRDLIAKQGAIVAIGGIGRGELAPYSDIDLLFLHTGPTATEFDRFAAKFVQICWDSGVQLGHAVRDIPTCISLSRRDAQIATALIEARPLWGNQKLVENLITRFRQKVIKSRRRKFLADCLKARSEGWTADGPAAQELQPDIKASSGGLRDLHLIRWLAYARYGVKDFDSMRIQGILTKEDAAQLKDAWEFLTRLRFDLHFSAGRAQDRLTRDEQLRIARERGYEATAEQRSVERFMQDFFHHTSDVSAISHRFAALLQTRSWGELFRDFLVGHRAEGYLYITPTQVTVSSRHLSKVCQNLESMLQAYRCSAMYHRPLAAHVREAIKQAVPQLPRTVSPESARLFVEIFRSTSSLGPTLRSMFNTGVLDVVIPDVAHVRNLLQFNQYHHFTVDEHTLRAVETVTSYEHEDSPVGLAYRSIKHKELLHLAVLLHDIGKGFERDHCEVGEEICIRIGTRLLLPIHQVEQLALLVRRHLEMADLAWRRDITDPNLIVTFSREIGSPDTLRMLYVLTAADVTSVGPGTWSHWKASLLAELFDSCLSMLSGKRYSSHEAERIRVVRQDVFEALQQTRSHQWTQERVDEHLAGFSASYLTTTPVPRIAEDLLIIEKLSPTSIEVVTNWNPETRSTEYRIITRNPAATSGCFYKMCGVLTAKRLDILAADINTSDDGVIIDSYQVIDNDYNDKPPASRFENVAEAFRDVLQGTVTMESLFIRSKRFGSDVVRTVSNLPNRVKIDNESSDTRTIIDVFAHDRPGLLYTVARTLFELNLSIDLAKISTHFDQVIDVFYVQEADETKVRSPERLRQIKERLEQTLTHFSETSHKQFISAGKP
ncbi:MAG TPA: [protein-PII] uridylyltransferase [Planctomicrobium sp.]|nr:[protein-PII] uridylyltransferase [Planctomicrobium sp.]